MSAIILAPLSVAQVTYIKKPTAKELVDQAKKKLEIIRKCEVTDVNEAIVVCGRSDEDTKYRVQIERDTSDYILKDRSWASRSGAVLASGDHMRANSNSVVGLGGQTGQAQQLAKEWCAEQQEIANARNKQDRQIDAVAGNSRKNKRKRFWSKCVAR